MRAVVCSEFRDPPQLAIGEIDAPVPGRGQVLVDVHAAAVSFMDALMAAGKYQMRPALPYAPGTDAAGLVVAVGAGVQGVKRGDRVACGHWHGAWAEQMVAQETNTAVLPDNVDFATASTVRYAYGTAHYALMARARLQPGEVVFVSGAAGGVGLAAVDVARHFGARVIAGVGSRAKAAAVRERGAEAVVVYGEENLKERIRSLTDGRGVDVFFDNVGGEVFATMCRSMSWGGRVLPIGFTSGEIPSLPVNLPLLKNYSLVGAFWGAWGLRHPKESAAADVLLMRLVAEGKLSPLVSEESPLDRFGAAIERLHGRRVIGRIVLRMR